MRIAIIDCETTGLSATDVPVSIGVIAVDVNEIGFGVIASEWYGEQEPAVSISDEAFSIHGIASASLAGKEFDLYGLVRILSECSIVIAHNAIFDAGMIAKVWAGTGSLEWRCSFRQWPFPKFSGMGLDEICRFYGVDRRIPHNAMSDAKALLKVLNKTDDLGETYLSRLIASGPYQDACIAAHGTISNLINFQAVSIFENVKKVEVIAIAIHQVKAILSPWIEKGSYLPIIQISWHDENALAHCEVGDSFSLKILLGYICSYRAERCILDIDGSRCEWLVKLIESGDEIGLTIIGKSRSFVDFAVWRAFQNKIEEAV